MTKGEQGTEPKKRRGTTPSLAESGKQTFHATCRADPGQQERVSRTGNSRIPDEDQCRVRTEQRLLPHHTPHPPTTNIPRVCAPLPLAPAFPLDHCISPSLTSHLPPPHTAASILCHTPPA